MPTRAAQPSLDYDIAIVLSQHACEPLDAEIEHLESILASLACRHRRKEVPG
jgi:hypothetical protein